MRTSAFTQCASPQVVPLNTDTSTVETQTFTESLTQGNANLRLMPGSLLSARRYDQGVSKTNRLPLHSEDRSPTILDPLKELPHQHTTTRDNYNRRTGERQT